MRIISLETSRGVLQLTQQTAKWQLISIKGTNPTPATIYKTPVIGGNGSVVTGSRVNDRQIVILLALNAPVEQNRLELYHYLGTNEKVRVHYKTDLTDVYIDGYIETNECDLNVESVIAQIVITCPQPFFKSSANEVKDSALFEDFLEFVDGYMQIDQEYDNGTYTGGLEFSTVTFNDRLLVQNDSQLEVGMIITIKALTSISNIKIHNGDESFGLAGNYIGGDRIVINTNFGEESVHLIRGDETINLLNNIMSDNTWMQLKVGMNEITYSGEGANAVEVAISYVKEYRGV